MSLTATIWILAILTAAITLAAAVAAPLLPALRSLPGRAGLLVALTASGWLLLRPHEDTFTGLDTSCYRLMAAAFASGRSFHEVDRTLLEVPPAARRGTLLEYEHWGRDTRDRSFEIPNLATGITQPYFYPSLPLAAAGLQRLTHLSGDYFVPLLGVLLTALILLAAAALGGALGWPAALLLLAGSPLPAYLLRGYYAEAAGAALAMPVLLGVSLPERRPLFRGIAPVLLGLTVCFHPVMIALALPALILLLLDPALTRRGALSTLAGFAAGLAPLLAMTLWVCQPYGNIASLRTLLQNLSGNAVHQLLAVFIAGFAAAIGGIVLGPRPLRERIVSVATTWLNGRRTYAALLLAAALPLLIPASLWSGKPLVIRGLQEFMDGIRWSYGLVLAISVAATFSRDTRPVSRALMILTVLISPLFFYLKGFEQMGLWSQRRLLPLVLLLIVTLAPVLATVLGRLARSRKTMALILLAALAAATLVNPLRWPAPYLTRHEQGTGDWVASLSAEFGPRLTFFDYHPYSIPFALTPNARVIGLGEFGIPGLPRLITWLASRATVEPVQIATAYINPGLEEGLVLRGASHHALTVKRAASRTALPAEAVERTFEIELLEATPAVAHSGLTLHKVLDDGPLALRGPWGRGTPLRSGTSTLPARWSRENSGVIGPLPLPGNSITVELIGAASRDDGVAGQNLLLTPPWDGPALRLAFSNDMTRVTGQLVRPATAAAPAGATGLYRLNAEHPYNPAKAGIRGYESDLGVRLHSITITLP